MVSSQYGLIDPLSAASSHYDTVSLEALSKMLNTFTAEVNGKTRILRDPVSSEAEVRFA